MDRQCAGRSDHAGHGDVVSGRAALLALLGIALLAPAHAQNLMGVWQRDDGIARVRVSPCGKVVCMTNIYIRPDVTDEKVGERLEFDLKESATAAMAGTVLDPKTGKSYSANVKVKGDRMTTRGCVLGGAICKTTEWTRVR